MLQQQKPQKDFSLSRKHSYKKLIPGSRRSSSNHLKSFSAVQSDDSGKSQGATCSSHCTEIGDMRGSLISEVDLTPFATAAPDTAELYFETEAKDDKKQSSRISHILKRVPSFSSSAKHRESKNTRKIVNDNTPKPDQQGKSQYENFEIDDEGIELNTCYMKYKSTPIDNLSSALGSSTEHVSPKEGVEQFDFETDLFGPLSVDDEYSDHIPVDTDSSFLSDDYPVNSFDNSLEEIHMMTAFGEDDESGSAITPKGSSSRLKLRLKTILSRKSSSKKKLEAENCIVSLDTSTTESDEFSPVELQIPVFRSSSASIPTLVSVFTEGYFSKISMVDPLITENNLTTDSISDHVKFEKNASLLLYDGSSRFKSKKKDMNEDSFYELNSMIDIGNDDIDDDEVEAYVLKKSTSSDFIDTDKLLSDIGALISETKFHGDGNKDVDIEQDDDDDVDDVDVKEEGTCRSILKTKVNKNAPVEIYRAYCCDNVDIDKFIELFETNERMRMLKDLDFGIFRRQQISDYYESIEDGDVSYSSSTEEEEVDHYGGYNQYYCDENIKIQPAFNNSFTYTLC